jgi:hypothetical protein
MKSVWMNMNISLTWPSEARGQMLVVHNWSQSIFIVLLVAVVVAVIAWSTCMYIFNSLVRDLLKPVDFFLID